MEINTRNNLKLILDDEHLITLQISLNSYLAVLRCIDMGHDGNSEDGSIKCYMGLITSPENHHELEHIMLYGNKASRIVRFSERILDTIQE